MPPIWHDLHEAQTLLYTFSGQPPQNANLDPILYTELPFFATYEVNKLTSYGMPGVWHFGFVDTWSPGYLGFAASNHNGMLRMYEIFNQGGANTKKARLQGAQTTREWYRPFPAPVGEVDWSIRNSVNYAVSGVLTALELTSKFPSMVVENFYKKTVNSIQAGQTKAPYAFVIPAAKGPTQVDRVVNLLRRQAIEVHSRPARRQSARKPSRPAAMSSSSISRTVASPKRCSRSRPTLIRTCGPTTTARGRWGWRAMSSSRRSTTRPFSTCRPNCSPPTLKPAAPSPAPARRLSSATTGRST